MNFHSSLSLRGTITNTPLLIMMTSSNGKSFALLAICAGNSPVSGEFPAQRPVTGGFDVFFDLRPDKQLSKQSWGWWFETPSHLLWRHRNDGLVYWRMTITRSRWYWIYVNCAFGAVISLVHSYMILYGLQLRTCVAEAGITSKSTGKTFYPMLRADSRFWLVNNREIWSRISRLTSSAWDIKTKERHWWRHNGDSDRRPISLPLRYDLITLCLYGDLGQINVIAGILKLRKRFRMSQILFEHGINSLPLVCFRGYGNLSTLSIAIPRLAFGRAWYCDAACG